MPLPLFRQKTTPEQKLRGLSYVLDDRLFLDLSKVLLGQLEDHGAQQSDSDQVGDSHQTVQGVGDIPSQLQTTLTHRQLEPKFAYSHAVDVLPNTPLSALIGTRRIAANSFHHQAIKAIGDGLAVMATAEDGVIEALYHTAHPYMRLYQWHPERLCDRDEVHLAPFAEFIAACRNENGTHLS